MWTRDSALVIEMDCSSFVFDVECSLGCQQIILAVLKYYVFL